MPRKRYSGLNKIRRQLSDGQVRIYYYFRATGARVDGIPGTKAFDEAYEKARQRDTDESTFAGLVTLFRASPEFKGLADKTRKDYGRFLDSLKEEFGNLPVEALSDHRIRGDFFEWRDKFASTPRTADFAWAVLRRLLSWSYDRGKIAANHAQRAGRLYESERADIIWEPGQVSAFMAKAGPALQYAMALALFTGQRQGDLLRLSWGNVKADAIELRQSKRRRKVAVPIHPDLKPILDTLRSKRGEAAAAVVLTTDSGRPWKSDHFRHEWRAVTLAAGLDGLHFHDLRGTACTLLVEAGCTSAEVASLFGWSEKHVQSMIDAYTARSKGLAVAAIGKLSNAKGTVLQNVTSALQNGGLNQSKETG